jgi:DNA-directed RNA polymerase subunit beta
MEPNVLLYLNYIVLLVFSSVKLITLTERNFILPVLFLLKEAGLNLQLTLITLCTHTLIVRKNFRLTTLLRAIGFETDKDILDIFGLAEEIKVSKSGLKKVLGRRLAARVLRSWIEDFVDEDTGEVVSIERNEIIIERDTILEDQQIDDIIDSGVKSIILTKEDNKNDFAIIHNTLQKDTSNSGKEAVEHIYRQLRNTDPPDEETARGIIERLFFSDKRYDLGEVGRYRINKKLNLNIPDEIKGFNKTRYYFNHQVP